MIKILKLISCGLLATLMFGCESNNDETTQSVSKTTSDKKIADRQDGEMIISYTDPQKRLHVMRGTDYADRLSYSLSKDDFQIFNIGLYLDYKELSDIEVLEVEEDQVLCRLDDAEFTLHKFTESNNSVSFEATTTNASIPFTVQYDGISIKSFFEIFEKGGKIANPFREVEEAKVPVILIKIGVEVAVAVAVVVVSEIQRRCSDEVNTQVSNCVQKGKCAKRHPCSAECIECKKQ